MDKRRRYQVIALAMLGVLVASSIAYAATTSNVNVDDIDNKLVPTMTMKVEIIDEASGAVVSSHDHDPKTGGAVPTSIAYNAASLLSATLSFSSGLDLPSLHAVDGCAHEYGRMNGRSQPCAWDRYHGTPCGAGLQATTGCSSWKNENPEIARYYATRTAPSSAPPTNPSPDPKACDLGYWSSGTACYKGDQVCPPDQAFNYYLGRCVDANTGTPPPNAPVTPQPPSAANPLKTVRITLGLAYEAINLAAPIQVEVSSSSSNKDPSVATKVVRHTLNPDGTPIEGGDGLEFENVFEWTGVPIRNLHGTTFTFTAKATSLDLQGKDITTIAHAPAKLEFPAGSLSVKVTARPMSIAGVGTMDSGEAVAWSGIYRPRTN